MPPVTTGGRGISAALAALRNKGNTSGSMAIEDEPEFTIPATPSQGQTERYKPGPLSTKRRATYLEEEQVNFLSDEEADSDGSQRSTTSTISMTSTTTGVKRKRGRPPTTGEYAERAAEMRKLARQERKWLELQAEKEMAKMANEARLTRASSLSQVSTMAGPSTSKGRKSTNRADQDPSNLGLMALQKRVTSDLEMVKMVASKSTNLKGTYIKALKDAVQSIQGVVQVMATKQSSPELVRLETANIKLEEANKELKCEMDALKREVQEMRETVGEMRRRGSRPRAIPSPPRPRHKKWKCSM